MTVKLLEQVRCGARVLNQQCSHSSTSENEASLFRRNSTCTRLLSAFAKIHGYNYLRGLVTPLIHCMEETPPGYELDPEKAQGQDVKENQAHVEFVAQKFLDLLEASIRVIPS